METNSEIWDELKKYKDDNPFIVPNGYFETLTERVEEKISLVTIGKQGKVIMLVKRYLAIAAILTGIYFGWTFVFEKINSKFNIDKVQTVNSEKDTYFYEFNEEFLVNFLISQSSGENQDSSEITSDDIITYLTSQDIDYELICENF